MTATDTVNEQEKAVKIKPLLVLRPRFDKLQACMESLVPAMVCAMAVPIILGTVLFLLFSLIGLTRFIPGDVIYSTLFFLSLILVPAVYFEFKRRACARTVFLFYSDYLEFQDFRYNLIRRRGRVRYSDIDDVSQRSGFIEGFRGLSSLLIFTSGVAAIYHPMGIGLPYTGLCINGLQNGQRAGEKVIDIIGASRQAVPSSATPEALSAQSSAVSP